MSASLNYVIAACIFVVLVGSAMSNDASPPGILEGRLKILSAAPVQPTDENVAAETGENYADYPLVILSQEGQKEIARIAVDAEGNYHVALPPGDYILAVRRRARRRTHAPPHPFTVVSNQTVHVDMDIAPDVSRE